MASVPFQKDNDAKGLAKKLKNFKFDELLYQYRWTLSFFLIGVILVGLGVFFIKDSVSLSETKVEVLESATESKETDNKMVVEVVGAVESPGVFQLFLGDRVEDALIAAGGVSVDADRSWMEKFLNRAAKLTDGQKIYIPRVGEITENEAGIQPMEISDESGGVAKDGVVNINTATQKELESLWGIGPVYAQNIIEHRPYSSVEELLTKKIIKSNVYERNKDKLSVY